MAAKELTDADFSDTKELTDADFQTSESSSPSFKAKLVTEAASAANPISGLGARIAGLPKDDRKMALETGGLLGGGAMGEMIPVVGPEAGVALAGVGRAAGTAVEKGLEKMEGDKSSAPMNLGKSVMAGAEMQAGGLVAGKALELGAQAAGSVLEKMAPAAFKALNRIPRAATEYVLKYRDLLEDKAMGTASNIDRAVSSAAKTMGKFAKNFYGEREGEAAVSRALIQGDFGKLKGALAERSAQAQAGVTSAKKAVGVFTPFSEMEENLLKSGKDVKYIPKEKVVSPFESSGLVESIWNSFTSKKLTGKEAVAALEELSSTASDKASRQLINDVKNKIVAPAVGGSVDVDKKVFDHLSQLYRTPGGLPKGGEAITHMRNVVKIRQYVEDNVDKMTPQEAVKGLLGAKDALKNMGDWDSGARGSTQAFIKSQYGKITDLIHSIPGFEELADANKVAALAMKGEETIGKSLESPDNTHLLLKTMFEGVPSPQQIEAFKELQALEEKTGQPVLQNLYHEYNIRKMALDAKAPFEKEFETTPKAEEFFQGLLEQAGLNNADGNMAREKLTELRKIPGMKDKVEEVMRHLSAREFKAAMPRTVSPFELRATVRNPAFGLVTAARSPMIAKGMVQGARAVGELAPIAGKVGVPIEETVNPNPLLRGSSDQSQ